MQSGLIENDHQEHLIFIRLVNAVHDQHFVVDFKNFLRAFFEKEEMRNLIETIFAKRECSILGIEFMHQCLH
jgi:hypothetical protein